MIEIQENMKINNIYRVISIALLGLLLASCNLDKEPLDYIPLKKSFADMDGLKAWDNGTTILLRTRLFGGSATLPQEVQADMLNMHIMHNSYGAFHGWHSLRADEATFDGLYHSYYVALADANTLLDGLSNYDINKEQNPEAAKATIDTYAGHAHFARAFYYYSLAIRWGVPYKEESAATDLCVPLVKKVDPLTMYPRASNKEVWDFILQELTLAEELLASTPGAEGADYISQDVATALKSRVYLYMGKMPEALATAEKLINSQRYSLTKPDEMDVTGVTAIEAMWHKDTGREQIYQPFISKPDELPSTLGLYGANLEANRWWRENKHRDIAINTPPFLPAGWLKEFYQEGDLRRKVYFEEAMTVITPADYGRTSQDVIWVVSKFKGNKAYSDLDSQVWGGYVPNGLQAPKPFRYAEQVLIAAEAAYESGDNAKALDYLNQLKVSRGLESVDLFGTDLQQEIRDERTRELAFEGFRLWDLRRWGMGVNRHDPQEREVLNKEYDLHLNIPAGDYRFVWGIPQVLFKINHKLIQNEGWEK